jgi:hypothetical protein
MNPSFEPGARQRRQGARRHLQRVGLGLAAALSMLAAAAQTTSPEADAGGLFRAAQEEYEANHWAAAYAGFVAAAALGHCEAARIALQMRRHGPVLYGVALPASEQEPQAWKQAQTCAGDDGWPAG